MTPHRTLAQLLLARRSVLVGSDWSAVADASSDVLEAFRAAATVNRCAALLILESSAAFVSLQRLLDAESWAIREGTVYTLAQFGSPKALPALNAAFHTRADTDPLIVQRLLGEISWLEYIKSPHRQAQRVKRVLNSTNYLTRWSALDSLSPVTQGLLLRLAQDTHPRVAADARFRLEDIRVRRQIYGLGSGKRRRRLKQHRLDEPLTFFEASLQFTRYLAERKQWDYTSQEFADFVAAL